MGHRRARESRRPAGRDRPACWSRRVPRVAAAQPHHGRSPVGDDLLAGDVSRLGHRPGQTYVVEEIAAPAGLEIVHHPVSLPVDVRLDAMRRLRLPRLENHPDILVRGADPYERETVEQPDPDVMTNPDIRTRQLVREVLVASFEVLRAHG